MRRVCKRQSTINTKAYPLKVWEARARPGESHREDLEVGIAQTSDVVHQSLEALIVRLRITPIPAIGFALPTE